MLPGDGGKKGKRIKNKKKKKKREREKKGKGKRKRIIGGLVCQVMGYRR